MLLVGGIAVGVMTTVGCPHAVLLPTSAVPPAVAPGVARHAGTPLKKLRRCPRQAKKHSSQSLGMTSSAMPTAASMAKAASTDASGSAPTLGAASASTSATPGLVAASPQAAPSQQAAGPSPSVGGSAGLKQAEAASAMEGGAANIALAQSASSAPAAQAAAATDAAPGPTHSDAYVRALPGCSLPLRPLQPPFPA